MQGNYEGKIDRGCKTFAAPNAGLTNTMQILKAIVRFL